MVPQITRLDAMTIKIVYSFGDIIFNNRGILKDVKAIMDISCTNIHQGTITLYEASGGIKVNVTVKGFSQFLDKNKICIEAWDV